MQRDWKAEAVKQWDSDPCGADNATVFGTREFFDRVEYERYVQYAPWLPKVIHFEEFAGKRVLEVGFGLGTDYMSFVRAGAECFGVDLTPMHIEATRRRLFLDSQPIRLARGDAEDLPFVNESMDAIYSFGVLHHTPGTKSAIREILRVLRPGGEAIVGLYHRDSAFWIYTIFVQGLLRGGFLRSGYRETVSRIERRANSNAVPLVKTYSRWEARRLFSEFEEVRISVQHFGFTNFHSPTLRKLAERYVKQLGNLLGWYVIIRARKALP